MQKLPVVDIAVLVLYLGAVVGFGCWFIRKSSSTDEFTAAGRSLPGWAVGLSIFGTYVSSISFLANPGKSFSANWNPFVFGLSLPVAAFVAVRYFVPFYRTAGNISAYSHLEQRFGAWARVYVVISFLLTQLVRMGAIMLLVALALEPLTGWDIETIILITGVLVTVYTLMGGIEAVIWTDVVQSIVLTVGAIVCVVLILFRMPEGPAQVFTIAAAQNKFDLGSFSFDFVESTFWVIFIFGIMENFRNFGIDQSYVQRYMTAKSDADARRSVWIGALMFVPVSAILFFIGTALFSFYHAQPELLVDHPELLKNATADPQASMQAIVDNPDLLTDKDHGVRGDKVFPHFIVTQLPTGMTGLLIAAILAAAMSSVDSSLNGSATLILIDIYKRFFRPNAGERESMAVLYTATLVWGVLGTLIGLMLVQVDSVLDAWWILSGILGGGMLGLFLLGFISKRANNAAAITSVLIGLFVITWMALNQLKPDSTAIMGLKDLLPGLYSVMLSIVERMQPYHVAIHGQMTMVIGTLTILLVGIGISRFTSKGNSEEGP